MPSDSNGVYTLPDGYLAVTGETILASQHNPPLEDLATSMSLRLMRSGAAPMTGSLKGYGGTVAAPDFSFNSATSTGIYKTTDGIGVSVGGAMVAEFTSGGLRTGSRLIGELVPFTGITAPALYVFPFGQTLSRTTYAALWAFAQTQIATGVNTFYNNGNGSTTFGIGDLRGRVLATKDNLGGVYAARLGLTYFGADPGVIGISGGFEFAQVPLPAHTHGVNDPPHAHSVSPSGMISPNTAPIGVVVGVNPSPSGPFVMSTSAVSTGVTIQSNGTGAGEHSSVQPTIIVTHLLFAGA